MYHPGFPDDFGGSAHRAVTDLQKSRLGTDMLSLSRTFAAVGRYTLNYRNMYPADIVLPMKEELTENGFSELLTAGDVTGQLNQAGTTLVMINSVCGCSAGSARPGVLMAVNNATKRPDYLATTFAGFDEEAVRAIRERLLPYPPSSPSIALFRNGELVHFIERHAIEGRSAQAIATSLVQAFENYCN